MCGSELFAYYLWAPAAFLSVMFKHKAHSSGLVSHWIPFMKILNLNTNNTALLLRLLLLCFFCLIPFQHQLRRSFGCFFPALDWFLSFLSEEALHSSGQAIRPSASFKPLFLPCQINNHPLGQCCVQVLRRERRVWRRRHHHHHQRGRLDARPALALLGPGADETDQAEIFSV